MQNSVLSLSSAMVEEFMLLPSVGRVLGASGAFGNSGFQSVRAKMPHVPHFFWPVTGHGCFRHSWWQVAESA